MTQAVLGIIGGSGIYDLPGIADVHEQQVKTPWGEPSDVLRVGRVGGQAMVRASPHRGQCDDRGNLRPRSPPRTTA